jgi:hypothetical protein
VTDFRVGYCLQARECLFRVKEQNIDQPEFWANLLGAISNACMASVPDSVVAGVVEELTPPPPQPRLQKRAQKRIKKQLNVEG